MLVIHRPVAHSGQGDTPFSNTLLSADVIDGGNLWDNFRRYYVELNGRLHASNLELSNQYAPDRLVIPESKILFPEFYGGGAPSGVPLAGHTHTHDGLNSSVLGMGAIDRSVTKHRSFGAWMCPSDTQQVWMFHGSIPLTGLSARTDSNGADDVTVYVDIPYPLGRIARVWTTDTVRSFTTLRLFDPTYLGKVCVVNASPSFVIANGVSATYLAVTIRFVSLAINTVVPIRDSLMLDWVVWVGVGGTV